MEEKVQSLLEKLKDIDVIDKGDKERSQALLEFLQMIEEGYELNEQERDFLEEICVWRMCEVDRLPMSISELKKLVILDVSNTQIGELPESIGELKNLAVLNVRNTQIRKLPAKIVGLENLIYLDLSRTKIEKNELLCLGKLEKLKCIGLRELTLHHIPQELVRMNLPFDFDNDKTYMFRAGIYVKNTALTAQPISLFGLPRELIENYYEEERVSINEAKVIFLGYSGAGKTETIKSILNVEQKRYYKTELTSGIGIWSYTTEYNNKNININLWDFGEQEIMHAMYRCFLTNRTCYVVIVDGQKGNIMEQAEKWLYDIRRYAPNCPVILAVNCINGVTDYNIITSKLKKEFPKLVEGPIYYSAKVDTEIDFKRLTDAIYRQASQLDSCSMEYPSSWAAIRNEVEKRFTEVSYLDNQEYDTICEEKGLKDSNIRNWLLAWFNDLGICFSCHLGEKQEKSLEQKILSPKIVTNALYIIINTCCKRSNYGEIDHQVIDMQLINTVMDEKLRTFERFISNSEKACDYILQIMRKFRLSYQVAENKEFIPALCMDKKPEDVEPSIYIERLRYEIKCDYLLDTVFHCLMISYYADLNLKKTWKKGFRIDIDRDNIRVVVEMKDSTILRIDVYTVVGNVMPWNVLKDLRKNILSINQELNMNAYDYLIVEDTTSGGIRHAHIKIETLLDAKERGIKMLHTQAIEDYSVLIVEVDRILGTEFNEEISDSVEKKNEEQGITINKELLERLVRSAEDTAKSSEGIYKNTNKIVEDNEKVGEKLDIIITNQEQTIEVATSLIAKLSTHQDAKVQQLAREMQQALNQKKSPWEKFREYLGDGANLLTIISTIAPFINSLLQVPEIQMLPEKILIAMRNMGAL